LHEREHAQFLSSGIADGLLLIAPQLEAETVTLLQKLKVPSVVVDPRQLDVDLPRVTVDNYTGVRTATEHLISLGHSRIAFIRGEEDMDSSRVRFRGFTDAMHLAGLSVDDEMTPVCSFNYNAGLRTASVLLAEHDPTAIMAGADLIALGAIDAARARGLSVPEDLSVIGFDDIPRAAQSFPPLTTVRQPLHEMGLAAARVLLSLVNGHPLIVEDTRLPTTFVPRMTTTGPRSEAGADAR
jgi:LacI family transcriptional regulator